MLCVYVCVCVHLSMKHTYYTLLLAGKYTSKHQHRLDAISCVNELSFISTSVHFSIILFQGKERQAKTNIYIKEGKREIEREKR